MQPELEICPCYRLLLLPSTTVGYTCIFFLKKNQLQLRKQQAYRVPMLQSQVSMLDSAFQTDLAEIAKHRLIPLVLYISQELQIVAFS